MRILLIHADSIKYEVKSSTKVAEKIPEGFKGEEISEVLVVFAAVESRDEGSRSEVAERAAEEIGDVAQKVGAKRILIYPYAHLSADLAGPGAAVGILDLIKEKLSSSFEVSRAPFGYYKSFTISCKGHPLSELSRDIVVGKGERESVAVAKEKKIKSSWYVLTPEGDLIDVSEFDFSGYEGLRKLAQYEMAGSRAVDQIPPHVKLMQRLELVDYEPGSDSGNLRWYPKGTLIKRLLEGHITEIVRSVGAMEVETPIMYDMAHPSLSKYLERFPARQYTVTSDQREFFLRFAACFGQYLMEHDMSISYRNLPLRLYELTHYSFRREQSGELVGLRRLRTFTMPDMHTLVADMEGAVEEFVKQYELCIGWMRDLGLGYEVAIRFVRDFFESHRGLAVDLVRRVGKPVLIEMWDERSFYFVMKFEFNFIDSLDKASALSTVQIDIENCQRFGITYVDRDGNKKYPIMLHASISGGIDRNLYALLEKAYLDQQRGLPPALPLWLSPTQVRICPVSDEFNELAEQIADFLEASLVRVDIDDRAESVSRKVRDAEREWVPYIVVLGERERDSGKLSVRKREDRSVANLSKEELLDEIQEKVKQFPKRSLALPRHLSQRPVFRG